MFPLFAKEATFTLRFQPFQLYPYLGEGVNKAGEVLDIAVTMGLVDKSGAWYSYNGDRMGQGRENAKNYLIENLEAFITLENAILEANGIMRTLANEAAES